MASRDDAGAAVRAINCTGWVVAAWRVRVRRRTGIVGAEDGKCPAITRGIACDAEAPSQSRLAVKAIQRNQREAAAAIQHSALVRN